MYEPSIELINASIFPKDSRREILRDLNVSVFPGELAYLVGPVGSGKSSMLKTLYGELFLRRGEGYIAGFALHQLRKKQIPFLRRRMGIIFQDATLLEESTVYQNLEFVLRATDWKDRSAINQRIEEVLRGTDTLDKAHHFPHQLSGGEKQRINIARALLNDPLIMLADEPTSNLDPYATREVIDLLYQMAAQGRTVVISTHNMQLIEQYPGRVLSLENGALVDYPLMTEEQAY